MNTMSAMIPNNVETVEENFAVTVGLMQQLEDEMNKGVSDHSAESYQTDLRDLFSDMIDRLTFLRASSDALFGVTNGHRGFSGAVSAELLPA